MDKDVVHIQNGILLSHKKNEIMPFAATWMDIEIIILLKPNRYKYYILLMCGIKKKVQMNLFPKEKGPTIWHKNYIQ